MGFVLNDVEFKSSGLSSRYFGSGGYYTQYGYGKRGAEPRNPSGAYLRLRKNPVDPNSLNRIPIPNIPFHWRKAHPFTTSSPLT